MSLPAPSEPARAPRQRSTPDRWRSTPLSGCRSSRTRRADLGRASGDGVVNILTLTTRDVSPWRMPQVASALMVPLRRAARPSDGTDAVVGAIAADRTAVLQGDDAVQIVDAPRGRPGVAGHRAGI